jgi:hypothetical protein
MSERRIPAWAEGIVEGSVLPHTGWPSLAVALSGAALSAAEHRAGRDSELCHAVAAQLPRAAAAATSGPPAHDVLRPPHLATAERDALLREATCVTSAAMLACIGSDPTGVRGVRRTAYDPVDLAASVAAPPPHSAAALWDNPAWALWEAHVQSTAYNAAYDAAERSAMEYISSIAPGGLRTRRRQATIAKYVFPLIRFFMLLFRECPKPKRKV